MRSDIRIEKSAFVQVRSFLDENSGLLAEVNASDARKVLDESVDGLTVGEEDQSRHRRTSRESRVDTLAGREKLLTKHIRAVAAAAQLKADVEPKLLTVVAPRATIGVGALLVAAREMVGDTEAYAAVLSPVVGPNYLDKLRASIEAVERAQVTGKTSRAQGTVATKEVKRSLDKGRRALRVLHPLVAEALENEPKLLAEWNARRKKIGASRPDTSASEVPVTVAIVPSGQEVRAA